MKLPQAPFGVNADPSGPVPTTTCPDCGIVHELRSGPRCLVCKGKIDFGAVAVDRGDGRGGGPRVAPIPWCSACGGKGEIATVNVKPPLTCPCAHVTLRPMIERLAASLEQWCARLRARDLSDDYDYDLKKIRVSWEQYKLELAPIWSDAATLLLQIDPATGEVGIAFGNTYRAQSLARAIGAACELVRRDPERIAKAHGFGGTKAVRAHLDALGAELAELMEDGCRSTTGSSPSEGSDGDS